MPPAPFKTLAALKTVAGFRAVAALALLAAMAGCGPHRAAAQAPADPGASAAFLAKIAKEPGIMSLPGGLLYKVERAGPASAPSPGRRDEIKINYTGMLPSGEVFDSTDRTGEPAVLPLGGLIPAWEEALPHMRVGDVWVLYVPASLGYGDRGAGPIPPGSPLVFRIALLGVLPAGGGQGPLA